VRSGAFVFHSSLKSRVLFYTRYSVRMIRDFKTRYLLRHFTDACYVVIFHYLFCHLENLFLKLKIIGKFEISELVALDFINFDIIISGKGYKIEAKKTTFHISS